MHLVEFTTPDNLQLPGLLFTPKLDRGADRKSKKAAINLHGNGSASVFYSVTRTKMFAQALSEQGIAFFTFNNRGAHYIKTINIAEHDSSRELDPQHYERNDIKLGTTYELIKDCVHDIDGAINFLREQGFEEFYLIGHSSGANKICVYDHYQPNNPVAKYVLLSGGDDAGIWYQAVGNRSDFFQYLEQAKQKINQGQGRKLIPKYILDYWFSYQSFYDVCNPDGDYNTFPFYEHSHPKDRLSTKPLFRYFAAISKPSLVVYGENDEYCPQKSGDRANQILAEQVAAKNNFLFATISEADHSFHYLEHEVAAKVALWLQAE